MRALSTVLITGTSRGIGLESALAFGRAGHSVAATMRNPARAPELARIAAQEQLPITVVPMDVDDDASVHEAMRRIGAEMGPIDVLVNNAGIERTGTVEELPLAEFRAVMETNFFGVIRCTQAVLPSMRQRRSGCIINIASISGRLSASPLAAYTASKFALEALSECLAQEVKAFGIRVAIVEPGIIDTSMAREISSAGAESHYPHERRMAALFSASLQHPVPPSIVTDKLLEIATGDSWQLRHVVGPDAAPFLAWRQAMSDEAWVDFGALDDAAWHARILADFGMDLRTAR
jgi:NAD(P)-dependent dehydrogenase (short-subunit alcohol dehydrogenase family)